MKRVTQIIIFSFLVVITSISWTPPVYNYSARNSNAGRQNWAVEQSKNGWIYFANNEGLVEYNGIDWNIYKMENRSIVRAVRESDNGRIYVGGQGEFGYFAPDEFGRLQYTNLYAELPEGISGDFKEVWDIYTIDELVYFRFRHDILIVDQHGHFTSIATDGITQASCRVNKNVYFVTTSGLYVLGYGEPISVGGDNSPLKYDQVSAMVAYGESIIIATNFDGLYIYNNGRCTPLKTSCDTQLKQDQIFSLAINSDILAIGTVSGGVTIIDLKCGDNEVIDISRGLGNNTLLSVMFDRNSNLWCGLDNGIDMVELGSPLRHLTTNGKYSFSGYCTFIDGDYIYLGTNQGLLRINNTSKTESVTTEPLLVKNSEGQVWNIQMIEGKIYCSHNRGLFTLEGGYLKSIYSEDGVWGATKVDEHTYIVGTYGGVELMKIGNDQKVSIKTIDNYDGSVREAIYHKPSRNLFFVTGDGLERITFDNSFKIVTSEVLIATTIYDVKPTYIDGNILIYTPTDIYIVNDDGELTPTQNYSHLFTNGAVYSMIQQYRNRGIWSLDDDRLLYRPYNSDINEYEGQAKLIYNISHFFIKGFTSVEQLSSRYCIINSIFGYSIVDLEWQNVNTETVKPQIVALYSTNHQDSLLLSSAYGVKPDKITLPHTQNSLRIIFGSDDIRSNSSEFSYKMQGVDSEWSQWSKISISGVAGSINQKEYTNLFEGDYSFDIRVRDIDKPADIESCSVGIKILPPWQRSLAMYMFYLALFVGFVMVLRQRVIRYYADRRRLIELQNEREIEHQKRQFETKSMEQENKIIRLKNEKLESEIVAKSAELSRLILNKLEKNDIITGVKTDLDKIRTEIVNERYDTVLKRIKTINRHLDDKLIDNVDWSTFEDNFNLTNNNFTQKITEQFSWMSINERKLCVYIKMGLQNKEIAPLLNLSVRGVEMLRYRIRKKMELERNESLYEFFQRI